MSWESREAYRKFLKTPLWKGLAAEVKARDGGKCVRCGDDFELAAHHREYPKRWENTTLDQLETLCCICHAKEHGNWASNLEMVIFECQHRVLVVMAEIDRAHYEKISDDRVLWAAEAAAFRSERCRRQIEDLVRRLAFRRMWIVKSGGCENHPRGEKINEGVWAWAKVKAARVILQARRNRRERINRGLWKNL